MFSSPDPKIFKSSYTTITAKWHKYSLDVAFDDAKLCDEFRGELEQLQRLLVLYAYMLSDMAGVEDLTELEDI